MLSENGDAYHQFANALTERLKLNPKYEVQVLTSIPDEWDMLVPLGVKAATAASKTRKGPVLNILVPKIAFDKILQEGAYEGSPKLFSAIYLEQPPARQLELIAKLLPKASAIGVVYSHPPVILPELKRISAGWGQHIQEQKVEGQDSSLFSALENVFKNSDVLMALPDPEIYNANTIRNILLSSYHNHVPLVAFSPAYVRAGALAAIYTSPEKLAAQATKIIERFQDKNGFPTAQYPDDFEIMINFQVAHSLGILVKDPGEIRKEMRGGQ